MTPKQRLELELSEKRQRINALLGKDELTDDERGELGTLTARVQEAETEYRAAIVADAEETERREREASAGRPESPEDRERAELREKTHLNRYVSAAIESRHIDGAEAEYNDAIGISSGVGYFPLDLLNGPPPAEERATTNTDARTTQTRWLDRLFSDTAAMRVGVTFESVEPGVASYPVTTAGAAAAQRGRTEAADDAAWTVGVSELKPTRNAVRLVFSEEDVLRLPGLEDALNRDLSMALTEGVDRAVFLGDAGANEDTADITGLVSAANVVEVELNQKNKVKPAETLEAFLSLIDGKHASMTSDLRCVLTVGAYRLWAGTVANSAAENQTVLAFLEANGVACSVRGDLETATEAGDFGAYIGRGRGIEGAGVAPIWRQGQLIRDIYTGAAKGEVALTLSHFWAFGLPRPTNFARLKFIAD